MRIPDNVMKVINRMNEHGYECFIVGGAVRSTLLNLPVHDYDLTTNALPEQTKEIFKDHHLIETGLQHGTVVVVSDHVPLEITTYRKETSYKDHRHPDAVEFTSALQEDCARRDFTVNALCYHPDLGLRDFYDGEGDLQRKLIRCIRNPRERFEEDALRILRAVRFAARLQFDIEENTAKALHECRELLQYISIERIHAETDGLLEAAGCAQLMLDFKDVLTVYLPELDHISPLKYEKTVQRLSACRANAVLRMAVLLSAVSKEDAEAVIKRLKYSNNDAGIIRELLALKEEAVNNRCQLRHLLSKLTCSYEDYLSFRCAVDDTCSYEETAALCRKIMEDGDCISLKQLQIGGRDLVACGIKGKAISETLHALLMEVMDEKIINEKETLLNRVRELNQ